MSAHSELCRRGKSWLLGAGKCGVAFVEVGSERERPDVLGFSRQGGHVSRLIEVKTSRADFLADKKKPWRVDPEQGMGTERYYLVPAGMVSVEELPEGWGLLYAYPSALRRVHRSRRFLKRNAAGERAILYAAARRVEIKGFWHVIESPEKTLPDPEPQPQLAPEDEVLGDPQAEVAEAEREVLRLMIFESAPLAPVYRLLGHEIPTRAEDEQAFVLAQLLGYARLLGSGWRARVSADIEAAKATLPQEAS